MYMLYFPFFGNEKVARDKKMKKTKKNNKVWAALQALSSASFFRRFVGFSQVFQVH